MVDEGFLLEADGGDFIVVDVLGFQKTVQRADAHVDGLGAVAFHQGNLVEAHIILVQHRVAGEKGFYAVDVGRDGIVRQIVCSHIPVERVEQRSQIPGW